MASYTAIADVSNTLLELLRGRFADRDDVIAMDSGAVSLVSPDAVSEDSETRLALSLYKINENTSRKNMGRQKTSEKNVYQDSPLALDLSYLLTAFPGGGGNNQTTQRIEQQRILGLAMQTFYDHSVISGDHLDPSLDDEIELRVTLERTSVDELTTLWSSYQGASFQPAVVYSVTPVLIDSRQREEITPVRERITSTNRKPDAPGPLDSS